MADDVEAYSLPLVAGDVLAILAEQQISRAHMVGHDWGAALAWVLASLAPGPMSRSDPGPGHRPSSRPCGHRPWASGVPGMWPSAKCR